MKSRWRIGVAQADLPLGCLKSAKAAVGRVLAVSVVAGQILKESDFVWRGTGAELPAQIPEGMRAFKIHLSKAVPDRILLYPGCIVDVLFTSKLSGGEKGQAVTFTILQGIQVLSVRGDVIAWTPTPGQSNNSSPRARGLTVTLLVDPKQAEVLQLASDNGTLSLTIRNPLDKDLDSMIYAKPGSKTLPYYESLKSRIREIVVIRGRNTLGDSQQAAVGDPNE